MPDPRPLIGLFGKLPAHGDFVRRGLPGSFVSPWDAWLQAGMETARESLGPRWQAAWDGAAAWRFALPAGACGPDPVAGVMLPCADQVGRRFPLTLAVLLPGDAATPPAEWFDAMEAIAQAARTGRAGADRLAALLFLPGGTPPADALLDAVPPQEPLFPAGAAPLPPWAAIDAPAPATDSLSENAAQAPQDDVLALVAGIGACGPPQDADASLALPTSAPAYPRPGANPLLDLIEAGADRDTDSADMLHETVAPTLLTENDTAAAPTLAPAQDPVAPFTASAEAPPAPGGGGWWTRGGGRMPPTTWALAALPSAEDFACLLEPRA